MADSAAAPPARVRRPCDRGPFPTVQPVESPTLCGAAPRLRHATAWPLHRRRITHAGRTLLRCINSCAITSRRSAPRPPACATATGCRASSSRSSATSSPAGLWRPDSRALGAPAVGSTASSRSRAKGRGFCPSYRGRRMTERAAHQVDHVLPQVPVRQAGVPAARFPRGGVEWVLSLPVRLRGLGPAIGDCASCLLFRARSASGSVGLGSLYVLTVRRIPCSTGARPLAAST
jgi:hypothetical protein